MNFVDLGKQYEKLEAEINQGIGNVLKHGRFIQGPEVAQFELAVADFVGAKHALGVANGTDAISLALMALDVGPGSAVFVPSFTFFATAEAVSLVGATPVFVDIHDDTYNIDADSLRKAIAQCPDDLTPRAVIAVDLFGLSADYAQLGRVASEFNLHVVEDAAQSFGGAIGNKRCGQFGEIATTSFFPAKPLGCYGDGGAVFTDSDALAQKIRSLRVHGQGEHKYDNVCIGMNSRLDTIQAAILLAKLSCFEDEIEARNRNAAMLSDALKGEFVTPKVPEGFRSAWAQYTVRPMRKSRDECLERLRKHQVPSAIYYETPLHLATAYQNLGYSKGDFPVAEEAARTVFSLPVHPYLTDGDIAKIAFALTS